MLLFGQHQKYGGQENFEVRCEIWEMIGAKKQALHSLLEV